MRFSRRIVIGGLAGAGALAAGRIFHPAVAVMTLPPTPNCADGHGDETPSAIEGPFYTPSTPERTLLREATTNGTPVVLTGRVLKPDCTPIAGAMLDFWHCDGDGVYDNDGFKLRGHQFTGADGGFTLDTVRPGAYTDGSVSRTPHFHVKVQGEGTRLLTTQLYFPDASTNAGDRFFDANLLVMQDGVHDGAARVRFDFVLV